MDGRRDIAQDRRNKESEQQNVQAFPIKAQANNTLFQIRLSQFVPRNNDNRMTEDSHN